MGVFGDHSEVFCSYVYIKHTRDVRNELLIVL